MQAPPHGRHAEYHGLFERKLDLKSHLTLADVGDVMNVRDVQGILGIGRNATYQLLQSGVIRSIRVNERRILITKQALEAFLGLVSKSSDAGTQKGTQV